MVYGYLIYHPRRCSDTFDSTKVYFDKPSYNQDPYIWNKSFLHSTCHITQMTPQIGNINFWVAGDRWPDFEKLYCDLVFVVATKVPWPERNYIGPESNVVDSKEAYSDHYYWVPKDHPYKAKERFTLKACPEKSFQPQDEHSNLIDILPLLKSYDLADLRKMFRSGTGSKPVKLTDINLVSNIYNYLSESPKLLYGHQLVEIRRKYPAKLESKN